jgi:hypothetical protein
VWFATMTVIRSLFCFCVTQGQRRPQCRHRVCQVEKGAHNSRHLHAMHNLEYLAHRRKARECWIGTVQHLDLAICVLFMPRSTAWGKVKASEHCARQG